ncbi:MAG: TonB-dependent receptor, partial [Bacteroidota bacterium]
KLAFMAAGRVAYPNWVIQRAGDPDIANSTANFYDGNLVFNYAINEKNSLEYSLYGSSDAFRFPSSVENQWKNVAQVLKWNAELSEKLFFDLSFIQSDYTSNLIDDTPESGFNLERFIGHKEFNLNLSFSPNAKNEVEIGGQVKLLENGQGKLISGNSTAFGTQEIDTENGREYGVYLQHELDVTRKIGLSYGMRYSLFSPQGPGIINEYDPTQSRSLATIVSSRRFGNETIQTYDGLEPRAALTVQMSPSSSVKLGYSKIYQYIHLITNTTSISPTDSWKLSDPFIEPQIATQYSVGLFKNFFNNRIETSVEGFYKDLENIPAYKDGANLFLNPNLETELTTASGRAYGMEFFLNKPIGRAYGWISYTYSRSLRTIANEFEEEIINDGEEFPANIDRPHNISTVFNYRFGSGIVFSGVFNYSTGSPFTLPEGKFLYNGQELGFFDRRNNFRAPDTHRLDLSLQFHFSSKKKIWSGLWNFSVYNIYGRKNPFSVFFQDFPGVSPQAYKLTVVGSPFPSLSYELTF